MLPCLAMQVRELCVCGIVEGHVQWSDEPNTVYQRWVTVQVSVDVETSPVYPFIG